MGKALKKMQNQRSRMKLHGCNWNDWQAQGYVIPAELLKNPNDPNNPTNIPQQAGQDVQMGHAPAPKAPKKAKEIPANPTDRHPVQLLNELKGGVVFSVVGTTGVTPNIIFTMGCEVDGQQYQGKIFYNAEISRDFSKCLFIYF